MTTIQGIAWRKDEDDYLNIEGYATLEFSDIELPTMYFYMKGPAQDVRLYCRSY